MEEKEYAPRGRGADEEFLCEVCGAEREETANFCRNCGSKIQEVCNCPFLGKAYNCGMQKCPGYGIRKIIKDQADS